MRMMKWGLGVAGLAAAGIIAIAAIGVGGAASAQTPTPDNEGRGERYTELLAQELGISVDELQDARKTARDKVIDERVAAGDITTERGEQLKALEVGEGLRDGIGKHMAGHKLGRALVSVFQTAADIVGIPADELRDRIQGGESLLDIAAAQSIDEASLKSQLSTALTDKINQAVTDGDIDQAMADRLLDNLDEMIDRGINANGPFEGRFERFRDMQRGPFQN